jgi:hypothetical protein
MNVKLLIASGSFGFNKPDMLLDERARFSQDLLARGIIAGKLDDFRNWVRKFIVLAKPWKRDYALRNCVL